MNRARSLTILALCFFLQSCAKHPPTDPQDPYEAFNRNVYRFNNCVDHTLYRPVAEIYAHAIPPFVQTGVSNFFGNIIIPVTFLNDLAQGKIRYAGIALTRFVINSTIGIAGLIDIASKMGIPKHYNNFGNTLAFYSDNKQSPFLMLPFYGPATFRDAVAIPFNTVAYPFTYVSQDGSLYGVTALYLVSVRAQYLSYNNLLDSTFDPYAAMRHAYLANRNKTIREIMDGDYTPDKKNNLQDSGQLNTTPSTDAPSDATDANDEYDFEDETQKKTTPAKH